MRVETSYNDYYQEFYKMESRRIPGLFKYSKKKTVVIGTIAGLFMAIGIDRLFHVLYYYTGVKLELTIIFTCTIIALVLALWASLCILIDQRVSKKASEHARYSAAIDHERAYDEWQSFKMRSNNY